LKRLLAASAARTPTFVWLGMAGVIVLDTAVQLVWKSVVLRVPDSLPFADALAAVTGQPAFYLLLAIFAAMFLNWVLVLGQADLSYVQPITALSYVSVAGCSALVLGEHIGLLRGAGVALIVLGAWLISRTGHQTTAPPSPLAASDPQAGPST